MRRSLVSVGVRTENERSCSSSTMENNCEPKKQNHHEEAEQQQPSNGPVIPEQGTSQPQQSTEPGEPQGGKRNEDAQHPEPQATSATAPPTHHHFRGPAGPYHGITPHAHAAAAAAAEIQRYHHHGPPHHAMHHPSMRGPFRPYGHMHPHRFAGGHDYSMPPPSYGGSPPRTESRRSPVNPLEVLPSVADTMRSGGCTCKKSR